MTPQDSAAATPCAGWLERCRGLIDAVSAQSDAVGRVADLFADTIAAGRLVHVFGSGHSRMAVEEMWPRYGSFPGFHGIVELSLTYHNQVVGANGQRQAMFLENVSGLAEKILRNFAIASEDAALVISSSGCNVVPIEIAAGFRERSVPVVAVVSQQHLDASTSRHPSGKKLVDFADIVLDTGAPAGDSMVEIDGLETPVAPGSTIGGVLLINAIKAEVADRLTRRGLPPKVLTAGCVVGPERAAELFEAAYDEHAHRVAKLFSDV